MLVFILTGIINLINISQMETVSLSIQEKKALAELNSTLAHRQKWIKDSSSDEGADLRAAAAYAILKIKSDEKK